MYFILKIKSTTFYLYYLKKIGIGVFTPVRKLIEMVNLIDFKIIVVNCKNIQK